MPGEQSSKYEQSGVIDELWNPGIAPERQENGSGGKESEACDKEGKDAGVPEAHFGIEGAAHIGSKPGEELGGREEEAGDIGAADSEEPFARTLDEDGQE